MVTSTSSYSNATSGASSTSSYGTVGHVQSAILMPQYGPQPAFTMNYLAPQVAAVTDPLEGLNDAERIQQQKRDANALTFSELYKLKRVGVEDSYMEPSKRAAVESTMKNGMVTSETLKLLQEEAKMISNPRGARKRFVFFVLCCPLFFLHPVTFDESCPHQLISLRESNLIMGTSVWEHYQG